MTNIINYTAWFNIFALAFNLASVPGHIMVRPVWKDLDRIGMSSGEQVPALYIDFISKEHEKVLMSFVMVPWNDMSAKPIHSDPDAIPVIPDYRIYTVSPFAVIYLIEPFHAEGNLSGYEMIMEEANRLFNQEVYETVIHASDNFTSKHGLQVMSLTEYPWYVDIQAALPGSSNIEGKEFLDEYSSKMIRLSLIPDSGTLQTRWLNPLEGHFSSGFTRVEDRLIRLYWEALKRCLENPGEKESILLKTREQLKVVLEGEGLACDSIPEFCGDLAERLLFYEPKGVFVPGPEHSFDDYVPKMTPDELLDFIPEIGTSVEGLPKAELVNLPLLVNFYKEYKKAAKENPGEWQDGNIALGAKEQEYIPSKEELLLAEVGERIRNIAMEEGSQKVKAYMKEHDARKKKIKYKKFNFIHMDVMGSGRFYYVEEIEKVNLKLY